MRWMISPGWVAFLAILLAGFMSLPVTSLNSKAYGSQSNTEDFLADQAFALQNDSGEVEDEDEDISRDHAENDDDDDDDRSGRGRDDDDDDDDQDFELQGPIEALSPATESPNQLTIYGTTLNLGGAEIELHERHALLELLDLAPTQFVKVKFVGTNAEEVEVRSSEAEGPLQDLTIFSSPPTRTVNRNPRTIEATFTVAGAHILCDNTFTRVQRDENTGTCDDLAELVNRDVEVEGLLVDDFPFLLNLESGDAHDWILATRVKPE